MKRDLQSKIPSPTHVFILVMSFGGATCKVNGWVDDFCCSTFWVIIAPGESCSRAV